MSARLAVVLFNLGGPDRPEAVQPFLFNLFNDPAIIGAPAWMRYLLAKAISARRAPVAKQIYEKIGGKSPLLDETKTQAAALERCLRVNGHDARVFVCMRYWYPMTDETVAAVKTFDPEAIVLLPLYPQFSTTTTGSSLARWRQAAKDVDLSAHTRTVCCYPDESGLVAAVARLIREKTQGGSATERRRILFSAHGLPRKVIVGGDPYQWQVERTVAGVVGVLGQESLDFAICYQSRVGPLVWIGPSLEEELERAAKDGVGVVVVPIAFVSEHSETLVELDIEYKERASALGVSSYLRVSTVGVAEEFIQGLAGLVEDALSRGKEPAPRGGMRLCPDGFAKCAYRRTPRPETEREDW